MRGLSFLQATPAYLGSKRSLAPWIYGMLAAVLPRSEWSGRRLLDPMCGSAAFPLVGKYLGFAVTAADAAQRGVIPAAALVANSDTRLAPHHIAQLLHDAVRITAAPPAAVAERLPADLAQFLVRAAAAADTRPEPLRSLLLLLIEKLFLRCFPMSLPSASDAAQAARGHYDTISSRRVGHYVRARSALTIDRWMGIAREINAGVFPGLAHALQGAAIEIIANNDAQVVYLDPPYPNTTAYAGAYAALDALLGDATPRPAPPSLDALLDAARSVPLVVISYGGPHTSLDALQATVARHRPVLRAAAVPYAHLPALATAATRRRNRELLVIAGPGSAVSATR